MPLLSPSDANLMLDAQFVPATTYYMSKASASPGTTGANEIAGVTRGSFTTAAASAGSKTNVAQVTITGGGTVAATHLTTHTAATGGSYKVGAPITGNPVTADTIVVAAGAWTVGAA